MSSLNFLQIEVNFKPSGQYWIASCPALGVVTQGESFEGAQKNLEEALIIFIESCLKRGTLEQVLNESGYKNFEIKKFIERAHDYLLPTHNADEHSSSCHA